MSDWMAKVFALKWLGVELEVVMTTLATAIGVASVVGWIVGFTKSRIMQSIAAVLVLGPGATTFAVNQWELGPWWSWAIGTAVGLVALPFLVAAARKAPGALDIGLDAAVDKARAILGRVPGDRPPPNGR